MPSWTSSTRTPSNSRVQVASGKRVSIAEASGSTTAHSVACEVGCGMPNRLAQESSPYLRQHADNPVEWWPWGEAAFAEAKRLDKPVFVSIGYAACHWCHVMAHESFEDPSTAKQMNELFVNIKIDREERPDVDAIFMN